jgi:nitrate/TMAO reductase-like tetraheme cytochrome c subunit
VAEGTHKVRDGEWVRPALEDYLFECCNCHVTHRMDFRVTEERGLEMRGFRVPDKKDSTNG